MSTITRKKHTGEAGNGGHFGSKPYREDTASLPIDLAERIVFDNYDVQADSHVWCTAQDLCDGNEPDAKTLLQVAIETERLNGDGFAAMVRENDPMMSTLYWNYGPENDPHVWNTACEVLGTDAPDAKTLAQVAIDEGHLDGDGMLAILRETTRR